MFSDSEESAYTEKKFLALSAICLCLAESELSRVSALALKPYGLFGLHADASTTKRPIRRDELAAHLV